MSDELSKSLGKPSKKKSSVLSDALAVDNVEKAESKEEVKEKEVPESVESKMSNDELRAKIGSASSENFDLSREIEALKVKNVALEDELKSFKGIGSLMDEKNQELVDLRKKVEEQGSILQAFGVDIEGNSKLNAIITMLDKLSDFAGSERISIFTNQVKGHLAKLKYDDEAVKAVVAQLDKEKVEGMLHAAKIVARQEFKGQ